jgi:hypothetical protein
MKSPKLTRLTLICCVAIITILGAAIRLWNLGTASYRADTIIFYQIAKSNYTATDIIFDWFKVFGKTDHSPFTMAWMKWFLDTFHITPDDYTIRLPCTLLGIAAIPFMFMAGQVLYGSWFGIFCALMLAVNPFHIQASMEAYFYALLLLGSPMLIWSTFYMWRYRKNKNNFSPAIIIALLLSVFLCMYSHFSGWWLVAMCLLIMVPVVFYRWKNKYATSKEVIFIGIGLLIIFVPLLFAPWSIPYILEGLKDPSKKEFIQKTFGAYEGNIFTLLIDFITTATFGKLAPRVIFVALLSLASLFMAVSTLRKRLLNSFPALMLLGGCAILLLASKLQGTPPNLRYLCFLVPIVIVFIGLGVIQINQWLAHLKKLPHTTGIIKVCQIVLFLIPICLCIKPAILSSLLTGKPTPYKEIIKWVDSNLPQNTPVLVDRWFEPWNELKAHYSTNVIFTFTIPNEPDDVFIRYNWRETAKNFLTKNRDAAFLQIAKTGWENPAIGQWHWPDEFFAKKMVFTNKAALELARMGLLYRNDGGKYNARIITELFYNTPDDVVRYEKKRGTEFLATFGKYWGYHKFWQQVPGDFRDWRVLTEKAEIYAYNLTTSPTNVLLNIYGVAAGGDKVIKISSYNTTTDYQTVIKGGVFSNYSISIQLNSGTNLITIFDPSPYRQKTILLVDEIKLSLQ